MKRKSLRALTALLLTVLLCIACNAAAPLIDTPAMRQNAAQGAAMEKYSISHAGAVDQGEGFKGVDSAFHIRIAHRMFISLWSTGRDPRLIVLYPEFANCKHQYGKNLPKKTRRAAKTPGRLLRRGRGSVCEAHRMNPCLPITWRCGRYGR